MATQPKYPIAALARGALLALTVVPVAPASAQAEAERVTVTAPRSAGTVTGFADQPLATSPFQVDVTTQERMKDDGIRRLSDVARVDAAVGDGYNAVGYYDFLSVRGFVLDNRFNYRREGLPISAETAIPLDNKARIEVLKGINGFQAGVGSPGGLVNVAVKRPTLQPISELFVGWQQNGSVLGSVDLSRRLGEQQAFGLRLNAAAERIDPAVNRADGERWLLAAAGDWRLGPDTLLEAEIETSRRSQPSVPGFSVLGSVVPAPSDPWININDQAWSLPSVFASTVGTLRWRQNLAAGWQFVALAGSQQLKTDDRIAFPFGCSAENVYDRFCSDGSFDFYDFRSEDETRRTNALDLSLSGPWRTGPVRHAITVGLQFARARQRTQPQAFNYVGTGNVEGTATVPPDPTPSTPGTNRDSSSNELYLRDRMAFDERNALWLGLRYTRQQTDTVLTDGTQATRLEQSFVSPWLAFTHALDGGTVLYASWGTGHESDVVPNTPIYGNRGQALDALQSRQIELGAKGPLPQAGGSWTLALFDIERPVSADFGSCDAPDTCTRLRDGEQRHRGVEAGIDARLGTFSLAGGAMALQARREGSADAAINGLRPTNVPAYTAKLQFGWEPEAVPGLQLLAIGTYESSRIVLPDNSLSIPGWGRVDLGLRYRQPLGASTLVWRLAVDNLFDERAWRESPFQFAHAWLFPLSARTLSASLQVQL
ncbi:MAG: TonB-dependent siderophore receptor [Burkholderiales bacterium]|nr:TonB-dependent siderophore receptor [Burkholderiales bacterium]